MNKLIRHAHDGHADDPIVIAATSRTRNLLARPECQEPASLGGGLTTPGCPR